MNLDTGRDLEVTLRRLLREPLLRAERDPDAYVRAVRVLGRLRRWFQDNTEWVVEHDPQARTVRLYKVAPAPLPVLPVTAGVRLTGRRVALALVVASVLEDRQRSQWDVVSLRDETVAVCRGRSDLPELDPAANQRHRDDLWAALRWLIEDLGVLSVRDGDAGRAIADGGSTNAVLDFAHGSTDRLLPAQLTYDGGRALHQPVAVGQSVDEVRRFVDRPALFDTDVGGFDPGRRGRLTQVLASRARELGLQLEVRREGFAGIDTDPTAPLAAIPFPWVRSTAAHCALLLAGMLAVRARDADVTFERAQLDGEVTQLAQQHARAANWSKRALADLPTLTDDALDLLVGVDLLRRNPDGTLTTTPLICRYAPDEPTAQAVQLEGHTATLPFGGPADTQEPT